MKTLWAGHIEIIVDDNDTNPVILSRKDGSISDDTYTPDGFFEKKAVKAIVDKLK